MKEETLTVNNNVIKFINTCPYTVEEIHQLEHCHPDMLELDLFKSINTEEKKTIGGFY